MIDLLPEEFAPPRSNGLITAIGTPSVWGDACDWNQPGFLAPSHFKVISAASPVVVAAGTRADVLGLAGGGAVVRCENCGGASSSVIHGGDPTCRQYSCERCIRGNSIISVNSCDVTVRSVELPSSTLHSVLGLDRTAAAIAMHSSLQEWAALSATAQGSLQIRRHNFRHTGDLKTASKVDKAHAAGSHVPTGDLKTASKVGKALAAGSHVPGTLLTSGFSVGESVIVGAGDFEGGYGTIVRLGPDGMAEVALSKSHVFGGVNRAFSCKDLVKVRKSCR